MKTPPIAISLQRAALEQRDGLLYIRHLQTGLEIEVSARALDSWCVSRLRESIGTPPPSVPTEHL